MTISVIIACVAAISGASSQWSGDVALDTLAIVMPGDTLRIRGPAKIEGRNPSAGVLVRGSLLVSGGDSGGVQWRGGKGLEIASGATAFLAEFRQEDTQNGIHVSGGQATVWASDLRARSGRPAAILSSGQLVVAGSRLTGESPVLVGWQGTLELDDVVLESDTLWRLDRKVEARFQDVDASGKVRIGQDPLSTSTHAQAEGSRARIRWLLAPSFGTRVSRDRDRRDVALVPLYLSMDLGSRLSANMVTGWRSGWLGNSPVFNERDQSLFRLQIKALSFLDLGGEIGYGGSPVEWDRGKAELAVGLFDRGMDLEEPFVAPGPLAGGRIRVHGALARATDAEFGAGYQWRGSSGATDLGDLAAAWGSVARSGVGRRLGLSFGAVWCLPDKIAGREDQDRWQWTGALEYRRNLTAFEWGGDFALEGRDDGLLGQRLHMDILFGSRSLRIGPAVSGIAAQSGDDWSAATGPGARLLCVPSPSWRIEASGYARIHRSAGDGTWAGGDLSLRLSGGF